MSSPQPFAALPGKLNLPGCDRAYGDYLIAAVIAKYVCITLHQTFKERSA